jgi:hypothetical protein
MSFVAKAADSLLSAIVPRVTAEAWVCPSGCHREWCGCLNHHIYNWCVNNVAGRPPCLNGECKYTVYTC